MADMTLRHANEHRFFFHDYRSLLSFADVLSIVMMCSLPHTRVLYRRYGLYLQRFPQRTFRFANNGPPFSFRFGNLSARRSAAATDDASIWREG